ncbi:uncharacterized protein [Palaemon carinicauda]|uniref:uncharacterized protein n=1 Tax=Palaemon carinicauda TaxID=392227 RepID=UPI0035B5BAD3
MVKLLLFPFALILAFVSAQADDKFSISDANNPFNFTVPASRNTVLASWTSDINNEITFEGFVNSQNNAHRLFGDIYNSRESNAWNFFRFYRSNKDVIINPGNIRYEVDWQHDLNITIKSTKKTYWRFCADIYLCVLPEPVPLATESSIVSSTTQSSIVSSTTQSSIVSSTVPTPSPRETALEITTIVLLSICCVLVAIMIGMAVYIIRGRRASLNEPARNLEPENTSHNPHMFNVSTFSSQQEDHESINSLYGVTINRESPQ